jgi:hypothetical protein
MYSILVYPNITYSKDLEKDSYVVVLSNIIKYLNKIRSDLQWTILSPEYIESLVYPNTQQVKITLPSYPNQMRLHFDSIGLLKALRTADMDYDVVYSHLPEHTLALKNLFFNKTNVRPVFMGYNHWIEFDEVTAYPMTVRDMNTLGILEERVCGVNTQAQKNMIIKVAGEHFNDSVLSKLEKIIQPHYLGSEEPPKVRPVHSDYKIIAFNHRPNAYRRYTWFLEQMDYLWTQRQDFRVWVSLIEQADRPYIITGKNASRQDYFNTLASARIGVCGDRHQNGWSISATDGISVGVPYLFRKDAFYRELAGDAGVYFTDDRDFQQQVNVLLDYDTRREQFSQAALAQFQDMTWPKRIYQFNDAINGALSAMQISKPDNQSYKKVLGAIKVNKEMSKRDIIKYLNWSDRFAFTPVRNRLRDDCTVLRDKYMI